MTNAELERLYHAHADALFAFLLNLTRAEADTRDAMQNVFTRLVRQPALLHGIRDERGFLLRMAHNSAIDLIRRQEARRRAHDGFAAQPVELFASTSDPDEAVLRTDLALGLGDLPPEQRAVVHLKLWEGLTFDRIAETLEIPLNTAASRYRYGLDKLRLRLRPIYDELR